MKTNKIKKNIFNLIFSSTLVHPWLKFIAFLLAVIVWFYVKGERI